MVVTALAMSLAASSVSLPLSVDTIPTGLVPVASAAQSAGALRVDSVSGVRFGVDTTIHVLTFSGPSYSLAIDLANHSVDGGLETPSSMCRSTAGCVAAVNGDFFDVTPSGRFDPGDEVGGIIQDCVLLHTPEIAHQQVDLDGPTVSEGLNWTSTLDVGGVDVPITGINQELPMRYLDVNLPLTGTLLFTPQYALRTPTAAGRTNYVFSPVDATTSPTTINSSAELELVSETAAAVTVAAGTVDVSAPSGSPLASLALGAVVTLTTTSDAGCNNIGGHPILLEDGVVEPISGADGYLLERYARTVLGWTSSGETVLMTVDGTDGRSGATAFQLDRLLRNLQVVTAIDLDGGDSTTLFANGRIFPGATRGERPVSTGLLVIENPST